MNSPLAPPDGWPADISLVVGPMPDLLAPALTTTVEPICTCRRSGDACQLEWKAARFHITADAVLIDARDPLRAIDHFWNPVLAAVTELRGVPTLHGFMAADPTGRGLAIVGSSGAGKSTTGSLLIAQGCRLVADDLIILEPDGVPAGRPFVRRVASDGTGPLDSGGKHRVPVMTAAKKVPLARVLVLRKEWAGPPGPVNGVEAFQLLLKNSHLPFEPTRNAGSSP